MNYQPKIRLKRLRKNASIRDILCETRIHISQLIAPLFIHAGLKKKQAIPSMPGHFQLTLGDLEEEIVALSHLGIKAVLLFGIPLYKDAHGTASLLEEGIIQQAVQRIKLINPEMIVIADVCLCEYTSHGHCGILRDQCIDNDATLQQLSQQALSLAQAGVDWIAPSANADGMVGAIRQTLDAAGFYELAILSYAVKYSSSLYGPFREAAQGAPQFGDRKAYQMNPANGQEALREARLDIEEGADMLMVKPAMLYLDVIHRVKQAFPEVPLAAYQVSGEFAMIKAAAAQKLLVEPAAILESVTAIRRAGADIIITYFAKDLANMLLSAPH
ncbi:MAG TPA: porphobilinogen synthase [Legionellaceae bacterium]|nr:porphobilinogen synthase [Legionellaceae bacterium]